MHYRGSRQIARQPLSLPNVITTETPNAAGTAGKDEEKATQIDMVDMAILTDCNNTRIRSE